MRRDDARTGWIIAVGGAFRRSRWRSARRPGSSTPTTSRSWRRSRRRWSARGSRVMRQRRHAGPHRSARWRSAPASSPSWSVLGKNPGQLEWVPALLIVVGGMAAVALALGPAGHAAGARGRAGRGDGRAAAGAGRLGVPDARPRDERDVPGRRPGERRIRRAGRAAAASPAGRAAEGPRASRSRVGPRRAAARGRQRPAGLRRAAAPGRRPPAGPVAGRHRQAAPPQAAALPARPLAGRHRHAARAAAEAACSAATPSR